MISGIVLLKTLITIGSNAVISTVNASTVALNQVDHQLKEYKSVYEDLINSKVEKKELEENYENSEFKNDINHKLFKNIFDSCIDFWGNLKSADDLNQENIEKLVISLKTAFEKENYTKNNLNEVKNLFVEFSDFIKLVVQNSSISQEVSRTKRSETLDRVSDGIKAFREAKTKTSIIYTTVKTGFEKGFKVGGTSFIKDIAKEGAKYLAHKVVDSLLPEEAATAINLILDTTLEIVSTIAGFMSPNPIDKLNALINAGNFLINTTFNIIEFISDNQGHQRRVEWSKKLDEHYKNIEDLQNKSILEKEENLKNLIIKNFLLKSNLIRLTKQKEELEKEEQELEKQAMELEKTQPDFFSESTKESIKNQSLNAKNNEFIELFAQNKKNFNDKKQHIDSSIVETIQELKKNQENIEKEEESSTYNTEIYNARTEYWNEYIKLNSIYKDFLQIEVWSSKFYGPTTWDNFKELFPNAEYASTANVMKSEWMYRLAHSDNIIYHNNKKLFVHLVKYANSDIPQHDALELISHRTKEATEKQFGWRTWYFGGLFFNNDYYWIVFGRSKNDVNNYVNGLTDASKKLYDKLLLISALTQQNNEWKY